MSFNIEVESGTTVKLPTAGKYCDDDIFVTGTGGRVGEFSKYAKVIVKPTTTVYFTIRNPLGGYAKKVFVRSITPTDPSSRKIQNYIADWDLKMGVMEIKLTDGSMIKYVTTGVEEGISNGKFTFLDGRIDLRQYSASNNWDVNCEYEVEIYQ